MNGSDEFYGACLDAPDTVAWAHTPDTAARFRAVVDAAAKYYGGGAFFVSGWSIQIEEGETIHCYGDEVGGCTKLPWQTMRLASGYWSCLEMTSLFHELGHVMLPLGDPWHTSHLWDEEAQAREVIKLALAVDADPYCRDWRPAMPRP
jgi:hypothetical protein